MTQGSFNVTIRLEPADDGWRAYEPASDAELEGRGDTPPKAVADYATASDGHTTEVGSDD